jgi:hypothetical protein
LLAKSGVSGKPEMAGSLRMLIKYVKLIAYKIVGFMLQWKKLMKMEEALLVEATVKKLQERLKKW